MRDKRLDVLRCVAVLLVLLYHTGISLAKFGWVGVDLFFVLSGFLISGLLFAEYKKRGSIDFKRFFIRRGLKIYPAFYIFVLATLLAQVAFHKSVGTLRQYLSESLYVQNYGPFIWRHTWSLAIEEHFYILLPIFLLLAIRRSLDRQNPFRVMPWAFLVVATACLAFRILTIRGLSSADLQDWRSYRPAFAATHCRMDSLFFGVLLGYLHHFRPDFLDRILVRPRNRVALVALAVALLSCCLFLPPQHPLMLTVGLTFLYLGFGIVLMLCLRVRRVLPPGLAVPLERLGIPLSYVGMYSYSIYLWHQSFGAWGPGAVRHVFHIQLTALPALAFYIVGSIVFGALMSRLIEYPVLRLRDRIFPAMQPIPVTSKGSKAIELQIPIS